MNKMIFASIAIALLSLTAIGFSKSQLYKNNLDCCTEYVYSSKESKTTILLKTIHEDKQRIIKIMQLKGHEYIVYIKRKGKF